MKGLIRHALEADCGFCAAQELYDTRGIILWDDFHLVWWDGLGTMTLGYLKMFRVWLMKNVSEFCGNNVQLYHWSRGECSPKCRLCGDKDKYTMHICRCRDPGCDEMFQISIREVQTWLRESLKESTVDAMVWGF